jgi:drug/metabolite transporter (DMT)-like permease
MARQLVDSRSAVSLVLASASWGIATVICKDLLSSVSPVTLLVIQLAPSVLLLWLLALIGRVQVPGWRTLLLLGLLGVLNPGVSYALSLVGLQRATASVASLLWASEPVLIVALAFLLLGERPSARLLAVTAAAACGVVLVAGWAVNNGAAPTDPIGCALVLGGVLCCALYTVSARRIAATAGPLLTVALQQAVGLLCAVLIWHFDSGEHGYEQLRALSRSDILWGTVSGVMYYAVAFLLYLRSLRRVAASVAGAFLNLIPVFGVATAFVFLGERLTGTQWIGAITILASVFILFLRKGASELPAPAEAVQERARLGQR